MATATTTTIVPVETGPFRYLDWGPVILGALGAAAIRPLVPGRRRDGA